MRRIGEAVANRFDETMKLQQVREIKRVMQNAGAFGSSMTGSGSAVFGIFNSEATAGSVCSSWKAREGCIWPGPYPMAGSTQTSK